MKPQSPSSNKFGSAGIAVLKRSGRLREHRLFVLADAKRGDIGSTMSEVRTPRRWSTLGAASGFYHVLPVPRTSGSPRNSGARPRSRLMRSRRPGADLEPERSGRSSTPTRRGRRESVSGAGSMRPGRRGNGGRRTEGGSDAVVGATIGSAAADLGIDLGSLPGPDPHTRVRCSGSRDRRPDRSLRIRRHRGQPHPGDHLDAVPAQDPKACAPPVRSTQALTQADRRTHRRSHAGLGVDCLRRPELPGLISLR